MAASLPAPGTRFFRTYAARGVRRSQRQPSRQAVPWVQPPDPKRAFSSSSFSGNDQSSATSDDPDDPDDPDFPGSPVRPRRRRPLRRISRDQKSLTATQRLRPRPPQKYSTPRGLLRPPLFPNCNLGCLSPDLSVWSQSKGSNDLGTSASLFSSPASPGAPDSPDAASAVPNGFLLPEASLEEASLPYPQEAATDGGRFNTTAHQAEAGFGSALLSLVDSGTTEDNEFGTGGNNAEESCRETQQVGNRLKGSGLARETRATSQKVVSQGADQMDCGKASNCKDLCVPGQICRPKRTESLQKRKQQEAMGTSALYESKQRRKDSAPSLGLNNISETCSWTKTRASFSFHKKKIVANVSEVCSSSLACSPSRSLLSECPAPLTMNRTVSSCHSSSMYLLSPLKTLHVTDKKSSYAEKVYGECNQEGPIPFNDCLSTEKLEHCEKIGEGVFGEVFQIITDQTPVALKVIAIEGPDLVNGSHQKTFEEILPEIIISKELSLLSDEVYNRTEGFIGLNSVHCVQGPYPPLLLKAWDNYNSTKKSANDRPDFFQEDQLFIILEFEFGGVDLEQMQTKLSSLSTAKSILHQVTASLAVAEASLHFEHRDLHWGNVLLKKTNLRELRYTLNGKTSTIPTHGLQVNIIDYTLSRLERDGIVVFCDISSEEDLFTGEGDYQFEIYRLMRKENRNCWGEYHPYNNVLWLHYLTDKILNHMRFKTKCQTTAMKQVKKKLQHFYRTVLSFSSATDLLCQHSLFQ